MLSISNEVRFYSKLENMTSIEDIDFYGTLEYHNNLEYQSWILKHFNELINRKKESLKKIYHTYN